MNRFIVHLQDRVPVSFSCDLVDSVVGMAGKSDKLHFLCGKSCIF